MFLENDKNRSQKLCESVESGTFAVKYPQVLDNCVIWSLLRQIDLAYSSRKGSPILYPLFAEFDLMERIPQP